MTTATLIVSPVTEALTKLPDASVHTIVTSPPYWGLRSYGVVDEIGQEPSPEAFVDRLVEVFAECRRVLRDDASLWINISDSTFNLRNNNRNGCTGSMGGTTRGGGEFTVVREPHPHLRNGDLCGIPWMLAANLQKVGYWWRQVIVWQKPNPMPGPFQGKCLNAHEYILLFGASKSPRLDETALQEPAVSGGTRLRHSVWSVQPDKFKGAHFATFPPDLIEPCILAGCPIDGTVLDPFAGTGTTGAVAAKHRRNSVLVDADPRLPEWFVERKQKVCPAKKLDIVVQGPIISAETLHD